MFLNSDKHNSVVYLLSYFYVKSKTLFDSQGTKKCSVIEMTPDCT